MKIHPVEFEIFKNVFLSIAEEMGVTLCRTGFSPNIKERLDYSCAVYDARGETIAQGDHMPVHLGAMPLSVRAAIDAFRLEPGDIVMLNDPFHGGTHLPDITLVSPVFLAKDRAPVVLRGESGASLRCRRDESRIDAGGARDLSGGADPAAHPAGATRRDPAGRDGAAARQRADAGGARGRSHRPDRGQSRRRGSAAQDGRAYGRRARLRTRLRSRTTPLESSAPPSGRCPTGGTSSRTHSTIPGSPTRRSGSAPPITIAGDRATVDFTGSDPQVEGSVNANYAMTLSACLYVFRCLVADDVLYNAGVGRPLTVIAPRGHDRQCACGRRRWLAATSRPHSGSLTSCLARWRRRCRIACPPPVRAR